MTTDNKDPFAELDKLQHETAAEAASTRAPLTVVANAADPAAEPAEGTSGGDEDPSPTKPTKPASRRRRAPKKEDDLFGPRHSWAGSTIRKPPPLDQAIKRVVFQRQIEGDVSPFFNHGKLTENDLWMEMAAFYMREIYGINFRDLHPVLDEDWSPPRPRRGRPKSLDGDT